MFAAVPVLAYADEEVLPDRLLQLAAESRPRPIEGRISASSKYARWTGSQVPVAEDIEVPFEGQPTRGRGVPMPADPQELHLRGLLSVFRSELDAGLTTLERAAEQTPSVSVLSDLAATYLALAEDQRPWLLVDAVAAANSAVQKDPLDAKAAFNHALALEKMLLFHQATLAWLRFQRIEKDEAWLEEADEHLRRLKIPDTSGVEDNLYNLVRTAALAQDLATLEEAARKFPDQFRNLVNGEIFAWARGRGGKNAIEDLTVARAAAEALAVNGDRFYLDSIEAIRRAPDASRLAAGYLALSKFMIEHVKCREDGPAWDRVAAPFEKVRSPFVYLIRLNQLTCPLKNPSQEAALLQELDTQLAQRAYPQLRSRIKIGLSDCSIRSGKKLEAVTYLQEALDFLLPSDTERISVLSRLSTARLLAGDRQSAWRDRHNAIAAMTASPFYALKRSYSLEQIADDLASDGREAVAREVLGEILAESRTIGSPETEADYLLKKVLFELKAGQDLEMTRAITDLTQVLERLQPSEDRDRLSVQLQVVKAELLVSSHPEAAVRIIESNLARLRSSSCGYIEPRVLFILGRAHQKLHNLKSSQEILERALHFAEFWRDSASFDRSRIAIFAKNQEIFDTLIRLEAIELKDLQAAYRHVQQIRARGLRDQLESKKTIADTESVAAKIDAIPANAVVLSYVVLPDEVLIFRLERGSLSLTVTGHGRAEISALVSELKSAFQLGQEQQAKLLAARGFEWLLAGPLRDVRPEKEIFVLPDRELNGIPFGALFNEKKGRFVIEDHPVTIAPSLEAVIHLGEKPMKVPENVLVVGDPAFSQEHFPSLPRLPGAAREADKIAALYPRAIQLNGEEASLRRVQESLGSAEVFHLAAHVILDRFDPLNSIVATAALDPPLRTADLDREKLGHLRLVFLSGCDSGPGFPDGDREGLAGLARTIHAAGVPHIVATLWSVNDRAAARLGPIFHARLLAGDSPAQALRAGQLALLKGKSSANRLNWAPFQLLSGL